MDLQPNNPLNDSQREILKEIYLSEYQKMVHFANRVLFRNGAAEDIVQEVFLIASRKLFSTGYTDRDIMVNWIYRTLINLFKQNIRASKKEALECLEEDTLKDPHDFEGCSINKILIESYRDKISKEHWEILRLYYLEGYPIAEIAAMHQISVSSCKMRLSRARTALRTALSINPVPPKVPSGSG